jgi:hypothetical protein
MAHNLFLFGYPKAMAEAFDTGADLAPDGNRVLVWSENWIRVK